MGMLPVSLVGQAIVALHQALLWLEVLKPVFELVLLSEASSTVLEVLKVSHS